MQLIKITQYNGDAFISIIPGKIDLVSVGSIDTAQEILLDQVKEELETHGYNIDPVIDDVDYRSVNDNSVPESTDLDHYSVSTLKAPDNTLAVAEVYIENTTQVTWFLVD